MAGDVDYGDDSSGDRYLDGTTLCASGDPISQRLRASDRRQARLGRVSVTDDLADPERRRIDLHESISAVGQALARPANGKREMWAECVRVALAGLSADFGEHLRVGEGTEGLYPGLLAAAPRLSNAVDDLIREQMRIMALVDTLLATIRGPEGAVHVDRVRDLGAALLARLSRQRQRDSDLFYEAYQADIGGES